MNIRLNGLHHEAKVYLVSLLCSLMLFILLNHLGQVSILSNFMLIFHVRSGIRRAYLEELTTGESNGFHYQNAQLLAIW